MGAFTGEGELVGSALVVIILDIIAGYKPWAMAENVTTTRSAVNGFCTAIGYSGDVCRAFRKTLNR